MNINLLPESHEELKAQAQVYEDEYKTQREDIDEIAAIDDSMYRGGTSRGRWDAEEGKWIPLLTDNKSNVGSILFHRQVNTRAGMLGAIIASGRELWEYSDKFVEGIPLASETSSFQAGAMNAFARWLLQADGWMEKAAEFCTSVYKVGNVFVQIGMKEEEREVWIAEDVPVGEEMNPETGEMEPFTEKKLTKKKKVCYKHPTFSFPWPGNVYLDKYIPNMQDQVCVIVQSFTSKARLMAEGKNLDQEAVRTLGSEHLWDGSAGAEQKQEHIDNTERDFDPTKTSGTMLRRDMWIMCPVKDGEWFDVEKAEEDTEYEMPRLYAVMVGNTPEDSVVLKVTDQFDPMGEIPMQVVRAIPADGDMFYHPTHGEIIRSIYCAECAIRNATIDNFALRSRPPLEINMNIMGLVKDVTWKPEQKWFVDAPGAIVEHAPPNITTQSQGLIDQLREEGKLALATDSARLGEYAGARTSKYEVQRVTGATDMTVALQNSYVVAQLVPWMARKTMEFATKWVPTEVFRRVVNAHLPQPIDGDTYGEYDIEVDLVGQYMDEQEKAAQAMEAMQIISNPINAQILPAETRLALIKQFLVARKFDIAKLNFEGFYKDSEDNAMSRIERILQTGVLIPPEEGENIAVHLRVARAQYQRWRGLENLSDPRAQNLPVLVEYISALKDMELQQQQQQAMTAQGMGQPEQGMEQGMPQDMGGLM